MNALNKPTDVVIQEIPFTGENGRPCKIAILQGGFGHPNPKEFMDLKVAEYTEGCCYNEFVEEHLDMPWIRIVLRGINELECVKFTDQKLKDNE